MPSDALIEKIVEESVKRAGLWGQQQELHFPTILRSGTLADGHPVHYLLNYSAHPVQITYALPPGKNLSQNGTIALPAWGVAVIPLADTHFFGHRTFQDWNEILVGNQA
jgi:beta-galactosidase